jgi:tRNA(Ile)-lysidine synthase
MKAIRPINVGVLLVRPLVGWAKRKQTESFCRDSAVDFRLDAMNDDLSFSRVRIRKELIPLLKTYNPKIVETLAQTSDLFGTTTIEAPSEKLKLSEMKELERGERYLMIRKWLAIHRGNLRSIGLKHIKAVDRLVNSRKSGRYIELPDGGSVVKRSGTLVFERIKVD